MKCVCEGVGACVVYVRARVFYKLANGSPLATYATSLRSVRQDYLFWRTFRRLPKRELAKHAPMISEQLAHLNPQVRSNAAEVLARLEPDELAKYVDKLVKVLTETKEYHWSPIRYALAALETLREARPNFIGPEVQKAMEAALEIVLQGRFANGYHEDEQDE